MFDPPRTAKGRATRARIVAAAAELVRERGAAETSLDEVIQRAAVSKSQLYHYFQDKADLLRAVIAHQTDRLLAAQEPQLQALDGWAPIRASRSTPRAGGRGWPSTSRCRATGYGRPPTSWRPTETR
jgi:AcrR family transcriptional regulator